MGIQDREHIEISAASQFRDWLINNSAVASGVWLVTFKKASGFPAPTYDQLVRAALCFGWVDSVPGKVDELRTKLYFSPRKPKSPWSQSNKDRVRELIESGEMTEAGLAKVEEAKANGMWSVIDGAQNAEIPADLAAAFAELAGSGENFAAFPRGVRKQIIEWITLAKTPETRLKRVTETATLAQQNIRANQWRYKQ